jgi:sec-independent protein translocase protein TatB
MFDVGFSEIVVIAVVALIVIGPEKLPKTARTLGHLFGRLQRYVNDVKADINREIELDELRKLQQQVKTAATDFQSSVTSAVQKMESGVRAVESDLNAAASPQEPAAPRPETQPLSVAAADPAPPAPVTTSPSPSPMAPHDAQVADPRDTPGATPTAAPPRQATLPGFDRG